MTDYLLRFLAYACLRLYPIHWVRGIIFFELSVRLCVRPSARHSDRFAVHRVHFLFYAPAVGGGALSDAAIFLSVGRSHLGQLGAQSLSQA